MVLIRFPDYLIKMIYYNIHTHYDFQEPDVILIRNFNVGEYGSFCGLDIQHSFFSLGIHPWKLRESELSGNITYIEQNAIFDSIKAIGECGLDKLSPVSMELQKKAFLAQIMISERFEKPLIIHCVKAFDELIAIKKMINPKQIWILHGFRGKPQQAEQLTNQGFFFSLGWKYNDQSLSAIPLNRLFLETDDEKISIRKVYEKIAGSKDLELKELGQYVELNVKTYFFDS